MNAVTRTLHSLRPSPSGWMGCAAGGRGDMAAVFPLWQAPMQCHSAFREEARAVEYSTKASLLGTHNHKPVVTELATLDLESLGLVQKRIKSKSVITDKLSQQQGVRLTSR